MPDVFPAQVVECINKVYKPTAMSIRDALNYELGALKVIGIWWSKRKSSLPVTIVEQSPDMCVLDLMLVYEVFSDKNAALLYPFNTLRNLARLQARTPVLALLDGDLIVSSSLGKFLLDPAEAAALVLSCHEHSLYVLPIFAIPEHTGASGLELSKNLADRSVKLDKDEFVKLVDAKEFRVFDSDRYVEGQGPTDTQRWYTTKEAYTIGAATGYEPYILIDRHQAPWHDSRFRGYGFDKVSYTSQIDHAKFHFKVQPHSWVVHRPHPKTKASDAFFAAYNTDSVSRQPDAHDLDKGLQLQLHLEALDGSVNAQMASKTFVPSIDVAVQNCLASLSWWTDKQQ
ncbi:MAG: hypothetical protein WDW38_008284 [Sanguina aurantia]